jgi:hypothetical protein
MSGRLPLPALLSQALVAYTVEFDIEFEHRPWSPRSQRGTLLARGCPAEASATWS